MRRPLKSEGKECANFRFMRCKEDAPGAPSCSAVGSPIYSQMMRLILLIIIWTLYQPALAQPSQLTIPGLGISLLPNASVPEGFAKKITDLLLFPSTE